MKGRVAGLVALSVVVLAASAVVALAWGAVPLPLRDVTDVLLGGDGAAPWQRAVLLDVRLPRVVLAAIGGGGLAVAGGVMQGLFRNPMADPGVLGVSGGAALGAVSVLYLLPPAAATIGVPIASFAGGLAVAMLVYTLASSRGVTPVSTLLLAGIAVGGIASAATSFVLSLSLADWEVGREMLSWLMGGLEGRSWSHVLMSAPMVLGGALWLLVYGRDLDVLQTGEAAALSLGVDVPRVKRDLVVLTALVTGATVAVMGVVGFVGLMVPHIVRTVTGPHHRRLLPASFVVGAVFLVWADLACRALPGDLRLGVVTAISGGPFFLYLLLGHRRRTRGS